MLMQHPYALKESYLIDECSECLEGLWSPDSRLNGFNGVFLYSGVFIGARVLNGPENYNPTRPGPRVFKPEHDAARHTSMNCLPEPGPPRTCIVFLKGEFACGKFTFSQFRLLQPGCRREYVTQRRQVCVCPFPWSRQQDLLAMIHNKQHVIYNLQEMCFMECVL